MVIGASFAGMLAAAGAAQAGCRVTVLERDALPEGPTSRSGVPQGEQAHILLHRGLTAIESLLPGIEQDLVDHGGKPFNTSMIPWLSEWGWMPLHPWSYEIISIGRPLLEMITRRHLRTLPDVTFREQTTVTGLAHNGAEWSVLDHGRTVANADIVIDASGRTSRLPHWLADLGIEVGEPQVVDSRLGYATRRYRGRLPLDTGAMVTATPETLTGALLLPIEADEWLVCTVGYGDRRPGRTPVDFEHFLAGLRDPVLAEAAGRLQPVGDVAVHRQTANCRHRYGAGRDWPAGLFVIGDALCAFTRSSARASPWPPPRPPCCRPHSRRTTALLVRRDASSGEWPRRSKSRGRWRRARICGCRPVRAAATSDSGCSAIGPPG